MSTKLVHHSKYTRDEIILRNKAMYEAVRLQKKTVRSQAKLYGITGNAATQAINQHETHLKKQKFQEERLILLNNHQESKIDISDRSVEILQLTTRIINALKSENVDTILDLTQMTESDLLKIQNIGIGSVIEITIQLNQFDLSLNKI